MVKKRILYFCSFVPFQSLESEEFELVSVFDETVDSMKFPKLSGGPCSFIVNCESLNYTKYDGFIFTNCCNSTQRFYDYIKYHYPNKFSYLLEIPRDNKDRTLDIVELCQKLRAYFGFVSVGSKKPSICMEADDKKDEILLLSSAVSKQYVEELKEIFNDMHISAETCWSKPRGDLYLNSYHVSCLRMMDYYDYIAEQIKKAKVVIYIIMERCDYSMFSFPQIEELCKKHKTMCFVIEEGYVERILERSRLRYEALKEYMELRHGEVNE